MSPAEYIANLEHFHFTQSLKLLSIKNSNHTLICLVFACKYNSAAQKVHWPATHITKRDRGDVTAAAFPPDLLLGYWDSFLFCQSCISQLGKNSIQATAALWSTINNGLLIHCIQTFIIETSCNKPLSCINIKGASSLRPCFSVLKGLK